MYDLPNAYDDHLEALELNAVEDLIADERIQHEKAQYQRLYQDYLQQQRDIEALEEKNNRALALLAYMESIHPRLLATFEQSIERHSNPDLYAVACESIDSLECPF